MEGKSEKTGMRLVSLIAGLALLVVFSGVVSAESDPPPTVITPTGDDIFINGDTYIIPGLYNIIDENHNGVLIINCDDCTLDCQGATFIGDGSRYSYGIYNDGHKGVTIKNCNLESYENGITYSSGADDGYIKGNSIKINNDYGAGIAILLSDSNNVVSNEICCGNSGIGLKHSSNNLIEHNTCKNNGAAGIPISDESSNNKIRFNEVRSTYGGWGVIIYKFSDYNLIEENDIISNWAGVAIADNSVGNIIKTNTITDNDYGFTRGVRSDYYSMYSYDNDIYDNYFDNDINAIDEGENYWNIGEQSGTNIIGGPYLGGNYWSDYTGIDPDGNGLGDTELPYTCNGNIQSGGDYLPLVTSADAVPQIVSVEILNVNDIPTNIFTPGDKVNVKATISNPSQQHDYSVSVSMNIDDDTDGSNGAIYDSHLTGEDWDTDIDMGEQDSSTWSWVVPSQTEAEKTYHVAVGIHDQLNYDDICYDCPGYMWDFEALLIDMIKIVEITPPAGTELTYDEEVTFDLTVDYSLESLDQGRVELSLIGSGFGEGEQVVDWEQVSAGSSTVSFTRATRVALGSHERDSKFVVAVALTDPNGAVCLAKDSLSYPISQPNLAFKYGGIFSPDGISIYPDELLVGDPVNIEVYWENKGEGWCEDDFDMIFYLGDPDVDNDGVIDDNANVIGSDHVDGLGLFPPDEGGLVVLEWAPSEFGTFDIYVVVDPEVDTSDSKMGAVVESDEDDNEVHTSVVVRPAIYGFVNVDVPRTHVAGIPVYLYQEGKGNIDDDITDTGGFYKFRLSEEIDPTTDKFYVLAKWENDVVRIRDWVLIGSEVIRARWPESGYMEIPQDGEWDEILFNDDDALRDYNHAKIIFDAINEAYNIVTERYYPFGGDDDPDMVDVYIHDATCVAGTLLKTDGTIHFANKNIDYTRYTAIHEYGHAIHYQYGGCHLPPPLGPKGMEEGWAMYFESLFDSVPYGDEDFDYCNVPLPSSLGYILGHTWGQVYAGIFIDLKDGGSNDDEGFDGPSENGEEQIWQAFMADRVGYMDEFYNTFTGDMNRDKKEAVRTIYATKRVRVPDYNLKFTEVDFPYLIRDGEEAIITFKVKNYADYSDSCDVILTVSRLLLDETNNPYPKFVSFGYPGEENGRVPIDLDSVSEVEDEEFKWKVDLSYSGEHEIHLALVPRDWPLIIEGDNEETLCFSPNNYQDNGWIDYESGSVFPRLLESSIVPADAPKGVSQKIESAIDKLDQVIDFLDQGKYCDAIGKLDGMITQIEGAIDQVNELRCSIKECKGKECNCIADKDANELIESLEHAKEGAIAIRDLISAEHPECA